MNFYFIKIAIIAVFLSILGIHYSGLDKLEWSKTFKTETETATMAIRG